MSDTPVIGRITFSSIANPNTWAIDGDSKVLVFASPSEAKRAEELFSAMQRELAAANAKVEALQSDRSKMLVLASRMADCINRCQDEDDCSDLSAAYDFRQEYPR